MGDPECLKLYEGAGWGGSRMFKLYEGAGWGILNV